MLFVMENPINMDDDWGYPHFTERPILLDRNSGSRFGLETKMMCFSLTNNGDIASGMG